MGVPGNGAEPGALGAGMATAELGTGTGIAPELAAAGAAPPAADLPSRALRSIFGFFSSAIGSPCAPIVALLRGKR